MESSLLLPAPSFSADMGDLAGWDLGAGTLLGDLIREQSDNKWNTFCLVRFVSAEKWLECLEGGEGTEMCLWDERLSRCSSSSSLSS